MPDPLQWPELHDCLYHITGLHDTIATLYSTLSIDQRFTMIVRDTGSHRDRKFHIGLAIFIKRLDPGGVERGRRCPGVDLGVEVFYAKSRQIDKFAPAYFARFFKLGTKPLCLWSYCLRPLS